MLAVLSVTDNRNHMLTALHIFPTAIQKVLDKPNCNVNLALWSKAKYSWKHHTRSCLWKQQRGEQRCFHIVGSVQVHKELLYESTKSTYIIKNSLKKYIVGASFPLRPTKYFLAAHTAENSISTYGTFPHLYKV